MPNPKLLTIPFADTGAKNDIPVSGAIEPQRATLQVGFPAITQQKITEGGIPPERADFNGILNLYGQHIVHLNKGLAYEFDQDFADAIGGYPLHAEIMLKNGDRAVNNVPDNLNDPNTNPTGWTIGIPASMVKDASGKTQQQINTDQANLNTAVFNPDNTINASKVKDSNGQTQQQINTAQKNLNDAIFNINNTIDASKIVDSTGQTQQQINSAVFNSDNTINASKIVDVNGDTQQAVNNNQAIKNAETVSLDDYLRKYGVSPTADISSVLNQIVADGVRKLHVKAREYIVNSVINFTSDFEFDSELGTVFNFGSTGAFYASGSHTSLGLITSDIVKNSSRSFNMVSTANIKVGDWLILYCPIDYSFSPYRDYYRKGEMIEVSAVSGNTVSFYNVAMDDYLASENIQVLKVNPIKFDWNQLVVKATDTNTNVPVTIKYARDIQLNPYSNTGGRDAGIKLYKCLNTSINMMSARNTSAIVTMNYSIQFANCQKFNFIGGQNAATRHAIALGGNAEVGDIPCRQGYINGANLRCASGANSAADMHGNTEFIVYDNCDMNYATMGGGNQVIQNSRIYERANGGCVYANEILGGYYHLLNNTYILTTSQATWSPVHFIIGSEKPEGKPDAPSQQSREDVNLVVSGGRVKGTGLSNLTFCQVRQSVSLNEDINKKINVTITGGITSELSLQGNWLWFEHATAGTRIIPTDGLIVDDVVNTKATSIFLINPSASALVAKTKQMRQSGKVEISSVVNNTSTRANIINLKYKYSKDPVTTVSIGNVVGGAAWDASFFNEDIALDVLRIPATCNSAVTNLSIRPAVLWNKKIATAKTFNLYWETSIDEI